MIRSAAKLTYQQAQAAIDGWPDDTTGPLLGPIVLEPLYAAYRALKRARDERAPLDLDIPERKIVLTAHNTVDRVMTPERLDSHRLIEEFMILANVAAAETLERASVPLIYRVHDEPDMERVNALREFLQDTRHFAAQSRRAARRAIQPHPRPRKRPRRREAGQRGGAADPGAGRVCRRELRPFRPQSAPLRAFHLADPPLRRSRRASRTDPRRQISARGPAGRRGPAARSAKSRPPSRPRSGAP